MLSGRHALVTDFGVAKAVSEAKDRDELTGAGLTLGTPVYMAPEQTSGDEIDHRADIYAFGALAYELLTGRPPFTGTTSQEVLSAHVTQAPEPVTKYRDTVPPALEQLVMKCLEKKAADRWQSAEELLPQLEALATPSGGITPTGTLPVDRVAKGRRMMAGVAAAVAAAIVVIVVVLSRMMAPSPITITTSNIRAVTSEPGIEWQPALSPDGDQVAFVARRGGRQSVVIRSTLRIAGGGELTPTQGVGESRELLPTWSPDGEVVRFWKCPGSPTELVMLHCSLREVPKLGGSIRSIDLPRSARSCSWSPDGARVACTARPASLFTQSIADGTTTLLVVHPEVVAGQGIHSPAWSPDGGQIAYVYGNQWWPYSFNVLASSIWIVPADGGEPVRVTGEDFMDVSPAWLDDDHLLFVSNRDGPREVYVVEVGPTGPRGEPRKVPGVTDPHSISYSVEGRKLAFSKAAVRQNIWSYPIGSGPVSISDGHAVTSDNAVIELHDISPDGKWIVYNSNLRGNSDIYKRPLEGGSPIPITDSPGDESDPRWSPDGSEIAFTGHVALGLAVMVVSADGGTPVQLAVGWRSYWSPSGLEIAFASDLAGRWEVWVVSRGAIGEPWGEATQLTDFGCILYAWAPDGSGVLCGSGGGLLLVSRKGEVLWRNGPSDGVHTFRWPQFSWDGSTIYSYAVHEDGSEGIWAIPAQGGEHEPNLVVAYDDAEVTGGVLFSVGPDHVYVTVGQSEVDIWVMDVEVGR
jgi:Tol biopolymer transport system component